MEEPLPEEVWGPQVGEGPRTGGGSEVGAVRGLGASLGMQGMPLTGRLEAELASPPSTSLETLGVSHPKADLAAAGSPGTFSPLCNSVVGPWTTWLV